LAARHPLAEVVTVDFSNTEVQEADHTPTAEQAV
jgi:hypothetical protein